MPRTCPYCAEQIDDYGTICVHCGRELSLPVHATASPKPRHPDRYPEQLLWRMTKDTRSVEAHVRHLPHGDELRLYFRDRFLRSELVRVRPLLELSAEWKAQWHAHGWMEA